MHTEHRHKEQPADIRRNRQRNGNLRRFEHSLGSIEHIVKVTGAKTMFATHYHELTVLENELEGVKTYPFP